MVLPAVPPALALPGVAVLALSFGLYLAVQLACGTLIWRTQDLKRRYGAEWALVTGASSGEEEEEWAGGGRGRRFCLGLLAHPSHAQNTSPDTNQPTNQPTNATHKPQKRHRQVPRRQARVPRAQRRPRRARRRRARRRARRAAQAAPCPPVPQGRVRPLRAGRQVHGRDRQADARCGRAARVLQRGVHPARVFPHAHAGAGAGGRRAGSGVDGQYAAAAQAREGRTDGAFAGGQPALSTPTPTHPFFHPPPPTNKPHLNDNDKKKHRSPPT